MPAPYSSYAALAAEHTEGVDYRRVHTTPTGWSWLSSAVHGGAIEPGTSEIAQYVAGTRMAYYAFEGIMASGNDNLHITSTLIDYPDLLALLPSARRYLSFHGMAGTTGVAEVAVGGLDGELAAAVKTALTTAGFSCTAAPSEISGTDPSNICSLGLTRAGVQLELSTALRASFFPGGDLSAANRATGIRTAAFTAFGNALKSLQFLGLTFDAPTSTVHISGNPVGIYDTFTRTASGGWGNATSGHTWTTTGGSTTDFSVSGTQGLHAANSVNVSRWATAPTGQADFDVTASFATDKLATGGSHFCGVGGRHIDIDNTYIARLEFTTAQVVNLTIRKRVAGVETLIGSTINTGLTHAAGTRFAVRFRGSGTSLMAKVWPAFGSEPGTWADTVTDSSITTGYRVGVRTILSSSNTNTLPVTYTVDDFQTNGGTSLQSSTDGGATWATVNGGVPPRPTALAQTDSAPAGGTANLYRIQQLDAVSGAVLLEGDQESLTPAVNTSGIAIAATIQSVFPPRVLVSVTGMTSSNIASATLYRQIGTERTPVRASSGVLVPGQASLLRIDAEQPFGIPLAYVAALTDAVGSRAEITSAPVTCTVSSDVISDAIRGVGAAVKVESPLGWKRDRSASQFNVNGRIVVVGRPRSAKSATITVRTETDDAGDALNELLDNATEGTILLRKQTSLPRLDGTYALLDDQEDPNWYDEYRWWQLNLVSSDDWPDAMEAAGYTLQDIANNFTTLQDIADAFPGTLLDIALHDFGT